MGYRPGLPWVMKVWFDGHLSCEIYVYVDDGQITEHCWELCWLAVRHTRARCMALRIRLAGGQFCCSRKALGQAQYFTPVRGDRWDSFPGEVGKYVVLGVGTGQDG